MMWWRQNAGGHAVVWLLVFSAALVGCGRLRFDSSADDGDAGLGDGAVVDANPESGTPDANGPSDGQVAFDADVVSDAMVVIDSSVLPDATSPLDAAMVTDAMVVTDAADDADAAEDASVPPCTWSAFGAPEEITGLNVLDDLWGPALSADGLSLYFSRVSSGDEVVMVATRPDRGTLFSAAVQVANVNSADREGTPFISRDGLTLYFFSTRAGGMGDRDIWLMTRNSGGGAFSNPVLVAGLGSTAFDQLPRLSDDGLTLWLSSARSGSAGACDIWVATRASTGVNFGAPTNMTELNSGSFDAAPSFSADGLFVAFASDRSGGNGQLDLWTATRQSTSNAFGAFQNLAIANTNNNDADPMLSADDTELFYSSDRDGARKIWRLTRQCL